MHNNQLTLLLTRRFLPLFITQFLGAFNDNVFKNALVILITYRLATLYNYNAQIMVTLAAGFFILPFFLFSATAGQIADKYEKSRLMKIIKFFEIIIMLCAAFGFYYQSTYFLLFTLFALGTQATFFGPLKYAILPDHLHQDELIAGNGLIEAGTFMAILIGTILGGILVMQTSGELIISAAIITFAVFGWISSCYIPKASLPDSALPVNYNFIAETKKLLTYAMDRRDLFLCILGISWFWLIGAVFLSELPVFAKDALHANEHVVTFFLAMFSIGLAVGSVLCNRLLNGKIHAGFVPFAVLFITVFILDLCYASSDAITSSAKTLVDLSSFLWTFNGWRISFDLLVIAICGGLYTVPLYALLQTRSEESHRARVIASNNVFNALFMVLAAIGTIIMLKSGLSVTQVFLVIAILNGFVAFYICKLLPDAFMRGVFHWILTLIYRVKVHGLENYVKAGNRVVIIANHTSFLDAILLATYLPDKLTFAIDLHISQKWWVKLFLHLVEAYPLNPANPMSIKSLIHFVEQNKRCVIFPEGRLTMTGALMKIHEGPGMIADKSGAKLLPVRIEGAQYTPFSRLRGKVRIRLFPEITITILPTQDLDIPESVKGRDRRQQISQRLYDLMTTMMFKSSNSKQTIFSSLLDAKDLHGRKHIIVEDNDRVPLNYHQVITRSFILGFATQALTKPKEYVGVLLPNATSNLLTFMALQAFSRVPAMLNYSTGVNNLINACKTAKIETVFTAKKFIDLAKLDHVVSELTKAGIKLVYLEDIRTSITFGQKLKGILAGLFPQIAYHYISKKTKVKHINPASQPAVVLFTSGSEGTPKGVVLSHTNLQANRYQLSACIDFTSSDVILNALPLFHSFGLTAATLLPVLSGVKLFLYPSPLHYRIVPLIAYDISATILFGTDTFIAGYAKYAHPYDFYSVRYVFAGAEKIRAETRNLWAQKFGIRVLEGYGSTEASPVISINTPMQYKAGTVGRLLPGIQYSILPVPGIVDGGTLCIAGANIMLGYLLASEPGKIVPPEDGWYDTGDVVTIDSEGFVTIKGRMKRFAKIAGEMISLTLVEDVINKLWPDTQHAVISVPNEKKGEELILITTNPDASRDALIAYGKANQLGEIFIPKKIRRINEMPLLGTGKINYVALKELYNSH